MKYISGIQFIILFILLAIPNKNFARDFHCAEDSLKIIRILENDNLRNLPAKDIRIALAREFDGIPTAGLPSFAIDTTGNLNIRLCEMDPLQFVNSVLALERTINDYNANPAMFPKAYAEFARRKGKLSSDWGSHFLFPADWLNDNMYRNNLLEVTGNFNQNLHDSSRTIDYVSHHIDDFPVLKKQELPDKVRKLEMGYVQYPFRYLPTNVFTKAIIKEELRDGDIFIIYSNDSDLDSNDVGFISKAADNNPMIIHVSPAEKKVCTEELPLDQYLKRNVKRIKGVRIFRTKQPVTF